MDSHALHIFAPSPAPPSLLCISAGDLWAVLYQGTYPLKASDLRQTDSGGCHSPWLGVWTPDSLSSHAPPVQYVQPFSWPQDVSALEIVIHVDYTQFLRRMDRACSWSVTSQHDT